MRLLSTARIMESTASVPRVLIVGGGLAGLSLAQGLKRANPPIPFHIFERDTSASFRAQGYRIRITPEGAGALEKLLPGNLWNAFEATAAGVLPGMGSRLNAVTAEPANWSRPPPASNSHAPVLMNGKSYNADRTVLRNVLMSGLDGNISFDKKFDGYATNPDGSVEVRFADGTKENGSVLIGADGVRSAVRRQLIPDFPVLDTEGRAVFGKTYITPELEQTVSSELSKGLCLFGESQESPMKLFSDVTKFDQTIPSDTRAHYNVPANYIYWVLCFRKENSTDDDVKLMKLTHSQSMHLSLEKTASWHSDIRTVLENQHEESSSTLAFYTCSPESFAARWEDLANKQENGTVSSIVTLLGDAAHPMSPVGGVGANSAFQEAADLCEILREIDGGNDAAERAEALRKHQQLMTERGTETIKRSFWGAGNFFGMKPAEQLKRATF